MVNTFIMPCNTTDDQYVLVTLLVTIAETNYSQSFNNFNVSAINLVGVTSSTSVVTPTTHPSARSFTINTGLTIYNSSTVGVNNQTLSIPTVNPTYLTLNFPTGLSVSVGDTYTFYALTQQIFLFLFHRI